MQFSSIPGNTDIKAQLSKNVLESRIPHAQLFIGPEGSSAFPMALAYVSFLFCDNKSETDSCGTCPNCIKVKKLIHPDLHFSYPFIAKEKEKLASDFIVEWREYLAIAEYPSKENWLKYLDAENKQGNININECHHIIKTFGYKSFQGDYKVLIMWLPEHLKEVGNALLKILEDPAEKTLFIFVAEKRELILNTLLSRMQTLKLKKFSDQEIKEYLILEKEVEPEKAAEIAFFADGNMSLAINLIQDLGNENENAFVEWMRYCFLADGIGILKSVDAFSLLGREDQKLFFKFSIDLVRECILDNLGLVELVRFKGKLLKLEKLSAVINDDNGPFIMDEIQKAMYHIERNANPRILFLDLSIRIMKLIRNKEINILSYSFNI